jgi:hypothetical protein
LQQCHAGKVGKAGTSYCHGHWKRRIGAQVQEQRWRRDRQAMLLSERQGKSIIRRGFAKLD